VRRVYAQRYCIRARIIHETNKLRNLLNGRAPFFKGGSAIVKLFNCACPALDYLLIPGEKVIQGHAQA